MIKKRTNINTRKYTSKHTRNKLFNRKRNVVGGGALSSLGNFIYTADAGKNYTSNFSTLVPSRFKGLTTLSNGINYTNNDNIQIYYNYNTHNVNEKTILVNVYNKPIGSSLVQLEPHIKFKDVNRYLIVLIDIGKSNKILWCAVFAYNSKQKTILTYIAPYPSYNEKKHEYIIKAYTYPDNIPQYTVIYMGMPDRMSEYNNFIKYINTNTSQNTSQINIKEKIRRQLITHKNNTQLSKTAQPNMKLIYKKKMYIYKDNKNMFSKIQSIKESSA